MKSSESCCCSCWRRKKLNKRDNKPRRSTELIGSFDGVWERLGSYAEVERIGRN